MSTKRSDNKAMRLYQVADRTGIPKAHIISILSDAGFLILGDKSNFVLKSQHLKVIQQNFTSAVKHYYKEARKNYKNYDNQVLSNVKRFLANFVSEFPSLEDSLPNDQFFNLSLDLEKVQEYFYKLIFDYYRKTDSNLYKVLKELKYQIRSSWVQSNNDLRRKSSLFFYSGHYYIFTGEEDSNIANKSFSFTAQFNVIKEALKNFFIDDLMQLFWKNKTYILLRG